MDDGRPGNAFNERYSIAARKIMRMISEDSRAKITEMASSLDMSRRTVALKLADMERELNLHYTLEFDEEKLGLNRPHLILAKFGSRPDYEKVRRLLGRSYIPQIAAAISGNYDLLIYANALSGMEYAKWDKSMQNLLSEYKVQWHSSEVVHKQLGFFPIRNVILEKTKIKEKYKSMLSILNENSRISFQALGKRLGMNVNTAVYNFNKIVEQGYIKSFTTTMSLPKDISLMTFFAKYIPSEGYENAAVQARKEFMSDSENPLVNRYLITAPLIGSYDFFVLGAFDNMEEAHRNGVLYHRNAFRKYSVRILYGEIKELLLGKLPIRSIDAKKEYKTLVWSTD